MSIKERAKLVDDRILVLFKKYPLVSIVVIGGSLVIGFILGKLL